MQQAGAERERESGGVSRPTGSGPRPAGMGGVARPCRAAGPNS
jgi:hypothetical protein